MKVIIFGATGFAGKAILKEALAREHQVTILVRNAAKVDIQHKNLTIVEGNALDRQAVREVLQKQDAVIQTLGYGGKGDGMPTTFTTDATELIIDEMKKADVPRLIAMSVVGAGNSIAFLPKFFTKFILPYFMKWFQVIIDDKNQMEPLIMNSGLDWTIIRSITIKDKEPVGKVNATLDGQRLKFSVALKDLASFMIDQLTDKRFSRQAPVVSN